MRDMLRRGLLVETQAKRNLSGIGGPKRIDTGRLRASISTVAVTRNGEPAVLVGTNVKYARWVHDGTGLYGPRHMLITPRTAKVLVFPSALHGKKKGKFAGKVVARSVKGMKPNAFLANALTAARG
ncbi:MAG: HK97 gp10 family phage protein [Chromatiaceae bacterium]